MACASAFKFFVVRQLDFDPIVGDLTLEEVVPSQIGLFSPVGGGKEVEAGFGEGDFLVVVPCHETVDEQLCYTWEGLLFGEPGREGVHSACPGFVCGAVCSASDMWYIF
jgi:hypothetical protein